MASFEELSRTRALRVIVRSLDHSPEEFEEIVGRIGLNSVAYAVGWSAWLDIAPEGVSKASALETVRRRLGVEPEDTYAVGDGRNDIEMLRWAAHSAAMGNALDDDVRDAAAEMRRCRRDRGRSRGVPRAGARPGRRRRLTRSARPGSTGTAGKGSRWGSARGPGGDGRPPVPGGVTARSARRMATRTATGTEVLTTGARRR